MFNPEYVNIVLHEIATPAANFKAFPRSPFIGIAFNGLEPVSLSLKNDPGMGPVPGFINDQENITGANHTGLLPDLPVPDKTARFNSRLTHDIATISSGHKRGKIYVNS